MPHKHATLGPNVSSETINPMLLVQYTTYTISTKTRPIARPLLARLRRQAEATALLGRAQVRPMAAALSVNPGAKCLGLSPGETWTDGCRA